MVLFASLPKTYIPIAVVSPRIMQFCLIFQVIFTQFQYSDQNCLPPDALRKALAKSFAGQHRFQIGHMDDAAECFVSIRSFFFFLFLYIWQIIQLIKLNGNWNSFET